MPSPRSEPDRGTLFRECRRAEALARAAEGRAIRRGDYAEADYWYATRWAWREKATALRAGGD